MAVIRQTAFWACRTAGQPQQPGCNTSIRYLRLIEFWVLVFQALELK